MPCGLNWLSFVTVQLVLRFALIHGESRFVTLPTSQTVIQGDSVTFSCHATPIAGLEYSWTHNGHAIINSTRIFQIGSNLHLKDISKDDDAGDYVCIATSSSSGARQASPPAKLSVIWLTTANVQLVSEKKDEIILKCVVDGSQEELDIKWFHNSEKLESVHNIKMEKNKLIIRNPSVFDNGIYRCIASNSAGRYMSKGSYILRLPETESEEKEFYSTVSTCLPKYPSKKNLKLFKNSKYLCRGKRGERSQNLENGINFLRHPTRTIAKENEHVELHCSYNIPAKYKTSSVLLKWRKDGKVLRQSDLGSGTTTTAQPNMESMIREDSRISLNRYNGSLMFNSVIASDAGVYDCQLHIDGHSPISSEKGELSVIEQLKFAPQPTSKNLELGNIGKVHCKAQGTPTPQVRWIKDNGDELPETMEDINGTLVFKQVVAENRGNYTCIASNTQGQINATVSIGVVVAPKFVVAPEGPVQAMEMGVAHIHCQAIGDPKPTIQWDKNLEYLSDNNTEDGRFRIFENGTLQITEVHLDDDGRYGCTIGNSAGLKREEVRLIVKPVDTFITEESSDGFMITRAVLITMSVAFAYIILVVGLMLWCRYRRQTRKARLTANDKENGEACDGTNKNAEVEPCLPEKTDVNSKPKVRKTNGNNNAKGSGTEAQKSDDTISSAHSRGSKKSNAFDQIALPRSSLIDLVQIGRGDFGDVFVGKIKSSFIKISESNEKDTDDKVLTENEKRKSKTSMDDIEEIKEENSVLSDDYKLIMVKALGKFKDENICMEFKREIEMFRALSHKGIVKLYGLCRDKDPHYMVMEYTDWGDLKQFLLATAGQATTPNTNSPISTGNPPPLKTAQILALAYQIARGMDAIYRARFIHKDLAARNCIISSDFIVKISYPALCKDKYSREYFKHRNTLLPIRWLPPECIQDDDYTTKSDIFSFGVLVWEIFTQAVKIPFEDISNEDYIQRSQTGSLEWECGDGTPNDLKDILMSCWNKNPKERPSFSQLCSAFSKSMQSTLPKESSDN